MATNIPAPVHALSVDVEDYFHVSAFRPYIRMSDWDRHPLRIEDNVRRLLDIFADRGARATFFWLGWAAERLPALVRDVAAAGHEIASHGYGHVRVHEQTPAEFRADIRRTRALLEDLAGAAVTGYRAASFSIDERNLWALDELAEAGYRYSSSISPVTHDHYGMRSAPRFVFRLAGKAIPEIPVSSVEFGRWRLPCGGGGFFRLFPYWWTRYAVTRVATRDGQPFVFYFHPWEIDPGQPRVTGLDARSRFRHYVNLSRFEGKLRQLLHDFRWAPMREVFAGEI
ncbi:MAG: DUF3473 domain-containing protein [Gammaproteobacteria bacterium]|nr:DUF3473 domain-containing protein [Gammaproteobacteria bacterium]